MTRDDTLIVLGLLIVLASFWLIPSSADYNDGVRTLLAGLVVVGWGGVVRYGP